jgi:succinate dehydrogenase / fumarate reductase, cytochrome b subunit
MASTADERSLLGRIPLHWICSLYGSTIGKKMVIAVTGLIGFGYVVLHVLGNLLVFAGPARLNAYGAFLKSNAGLLWTVRIILLAAVILHSVAASQLARISWNSRPIHYHRWRPVGSTLVSRTMRWSGPMIGLFIIYHLLPLTAGTVPPNFQPGDVYANVVTGFLVWYASAFYIAAMLVWGPHLYHGVWSLCQSVGMNASYVNGGIRTFATYATLAVVLGFIAIPVAVLLGLLA